MEGQLGEHPLAELIRETSAAKLSGALRLARERVKVVVYFEKGAVVYAASNLRTHRLSEFLQRNSVSRDSPAAQIPRSATDDELANMLVERGVLTADALTRIRVNQVSDVLRLALLWTGGTWEFDPRVRVADDLRLQIDANRLLLECARHLPAVFVASRFNGTRGTLSRTEIPAGIMNLLPAEEFVLSRATSPITVAELAALSRLPQEDGIRTIYALALSGLLERSDWPSASVTDRPPVGGWKESKAAPAAQKPAETVRADSPAPKVQASDPEELFVRLERANDHYEVLNLGRLASPEEIKSAYHELALRYHPDRFHQSEPELRSRVESAFARIARAYETLRDQALRRAYDAKRAGKPPKAAAPSAPASGKNENKNDNNAPTEQESNASRAEASFQRGKAEWQQNRHDEAIRFLAEAAMIAPREARYHAHYGHALIGRMNTRRVAEVELQTAISLEPDNASYRVMLAELFKTLGLRRRAEGELQRALAIDPKNEPAKALLSSLRSKG